MSEPFIGEVMMVGFNFPPRGWATCEGQLLPISQNTALFSLLGTTFGGDGRTSFGLPDLRGRSAIGRGNGPGLNPVTWGQRGGRDTVTLTTTQLPSHNHALEAEAASGTVKTASGNLLADTTVDTPYVPGNTRPNAQMASDAIGFTGGGQPFNIQDPYLGMYYNIALVGIFPSRS